MFHCPARPPDSLILFKFCSYLPIHLFSEQRDLLFACRVNIVCLMLPVSSSSAPVLFDHSFYQVFFRFKSSLFALSCVTSSVLKHAHAHIHMRQKQNMKLTKAAYDDGGVLRKNKMEMGCCIRC